jgi:hypothetical protein
MQKVAWFPHYVVRSRCPSRHTAGASTAVSVTTVAAVSITTTVAAAVVVPNMGIT